MCPLKSNPTQATHDTGAKHQHGGWAASRPFTYVLPVDSAFRPSAFVKFERLRDWSCCHSPPLESIDPLFFPLHTFYVGVTHTNCARGFAFVPVRALRPIAEAEAAAAAATNHPTRRGTHTQTRHNSMPGLETHTAQRPPSPQPELAHAHSPSHVCSGQPLGGLHAAASAADSACIPVPTLTDPDPLGFFPNRPTHPAHPHTNHS